MKLIVNFNYEHPNQFKNSFFLIMSRRNQVKGAIEPAPKTDTRSIAASPGTRRGGCIASMKGVR